MTEGLKPRQKAFADYYIETGNAEESAVRAGYSKAYARGNAHKLVAHSGIAAYIAERVKPTEEKRIATGDEIMQFFTAVMRGEILDAFELPPSLADRKDAAKELAKRVIDVGNKEMQGGITIVNNIPRPDNSKSD